MTRDTLEGTAPGPAIIWPAASWSARIRALHWVSALAVASQLSIGFLLLGGAAMATSPWLGVHLSLGLAILALSFVRFAWRLVDATPHRSGPRTLRALAGLGHFGLYALLVLVPLTGWLGYRPAPFMAPPHLLGIFQMPVISWLDPLSSRTMLTIHSLASWILLVLIGLHVSAALIHTLVLRDSVLRSMVFGARSAQ